MQIASVRAAHAWMPYTLLYCYIFAVLIPYQADKMLVWDVTVVSTLADLYVAAAVREAGEVGEQAAVRKCAKYAELTSTFSFFPIAIEISDQ